MSEEENRIAEARIEWKRKERIETRDERIERTLSPVSRDPLNVRNVSRAHQKRTWPQAGVIISGGFREVLRPRARTETSSMKSSASRGWGALLLYRGTAPPSFVSFFPTRPILVACSRNMLALSADSSRSDQLLVFESVVRS